MIATTLTKSEKIVINTSKKAHVIDLTEIEYIQSHHCYTNFYTIDNSSITSSKPIKYYEELLKNKDFIRIHNQYLVNKHHIKEILSGIPLKVVLTSGSVLTVTRFKKHELLKNYIG
ncbi:MAG: LytTR family transcriptional regulator [Bacteroidales bacterium]|nr:LytTR family transcriptional regulator [Bacteroidales bacterium]